MAIDKIGFNKGKRDPFYKATLAGRDEDEVKKKFQERAEEAQTEAIKEAVLRADELSARRYERDPMSLYAETGAGVGTAAGSLMNVSGLAARALESAQIKQAGAGGIARVLAGLAKGNTVTLAEEQTPGKMTKPLSEEETNYELATNRLKGQRARSIASKLDKLQSQEKKLGKGRAFEQYLRRNIETFGDVI